MGHITQLEMDGLITELIQFAPAVAILLFLNIRQDRRIEKLVRALTHCYKDCEDRLEAVEDKLHKL